MNQKLLSISKASNILGVSISTLRRWQTEGKLQPVKTYGNHRRYRFDDLQKLCGEEQNISSNNITRVATYCRVSSGDQKQKGDLERQSGRVLSYCVKQNYHIIKSYEEVRSGMSSTRPKLIQLFKLVEDKQIDKVVIEYKDRLTRFNFDFLVYFFKSHNVEIEWIDDVLGKSFEEELVEDMLSLMSSFSNKIYGKRSAQIKQQKKLLGAT